MKNRVTLPVLLAIVPIGIVALTGMNAVNALRVRVTGRIVASGHQSPIYGASVTLLPEDVSEEVADGLSLKTIEWEALLWDDRMSPHPRPPRGSIGRSTTWTDGVFHTQVVMQGTAGGPRPPGTGGAPASPHGTWTLRIDIAGRDPVILDVPEGAWTQHDDEDGLWATWDLGVVEVPSTP